MRTNIIVQIQFAIKHFLQAIFRVGEPCIQMRSFAYIVMLRHSLFCFGCKPTHTGQIYDLRPTFVDSIQGRLKSKNPRSGAQTTNDYGPIYLQFPLIIPTFYL